MNWTGQELENLLLSLNNCDIDIRPTGRPGDPAQKLSVGYAVWDATADATGLYALTFVATYKDQASQPMRVTTPAGVLLATLAPGSTTIMTISWPSAASKQVVVRSPTGTHELSAKGTFDNTERIASPCFELEDPKPADPMAKEEKVRIRLHYKGLQISLVAWRS